MKYNSMLSFLVFLLIFSSIIQPVSAGSIDTGIQVVSQGIDNYLKEKQEESFQQTFGVSFGNTSEVEDLTPAQKLVYMIGAAEQNPYEVKSVRDTFSHDFVWYYVALVGVSIITGILTLLHKVAPEAVGGFSNRFIGHESPFDYSVWAETILFLAILPVFAMPLIEGALELEQKISSGMLQNALEFLQMNSPTAGGIFFFEGWIYSACGSLFVMRIQYINEFAEHAMKIIFLFSIAWLHSRGFAKVLGEWFLSALFMRPIVLWYSSMAVKHIGTFNTAYGITQNMTPNQAYSQVWSTTLDVAGSITIDMTLVLIASFVTAAIMILWPVFKFIIKVIMDYLIGALYKVYRANQAFEKLKGN